MIKNPRNAGAKPKPEEKKQRQRSISIKPVNDDFLKTLEKPSALIDSLLDSYREQLNQPTKNPNS